MSQNQNQVLKKTVSKQQGNPKASPGPIQKLTKAFFSQQISLHREGVKN